VIETRADALLQAAGVYAYVHPLDSAVAYKEQLARLKADIKIEVTARRAVTGSVGWTVNGSRTQGAKMVKDFSILMLRAYNAYADNCVRTVKPHTLHGARQRLDKTRTTIAKLGRTMSIAIAEHYLAKVEAERELVRAQKEAAREEERALLDWAHTTPPHVVRKPADQRGFAVIPDGGRSSGVSPGSPRTAGWRGTTNVTPPGPRP
jgi:hypothetical protein